MFCIMENQNIMLHMNLGLIYLYWIFYDLEPNASTLAEMYENKMIKRIINWIFFQGASNKKHTTES